MGIRGRKIKYEIIMLLTAIIRKGGSPVGKKREGLIRVFRLRDTSKGRKKKRGNP